jgi:hypothetical protein
MEGCDIPSASAPALIPSCTIAARNASIILWVMIFLGMAAREVGW